MTELEKDVLSSEEEEDIDDRKHGQLIDAIYSLDGRKRNKLSGRTVISNQISEFNFTSSKEASSKVNLHELIGSLKETTSHGELKKQLREIEKKRNTVATPLPKHEKEKIERSAAYETVSVDISKWDPIVQQNQKAEQLSFPLQKQDFQVITTDQFVKRFEPRTPLEQEVAALLRGSENVIHGERKELTVAEQKALKAMDLEEAKMRRLELMKHRALMSYKETKAKRQKKIKSKKFHRLLKKDKLKAEGKKMDKMKEEDPEAFLEKLNQLDKDRIQERMSLKHRGGSKYAKRQALYAKYDDRARQEVQDMLQKSRELTKKVQVESESDNDEAYPDIGVDDDVVLPALTTLKTSNNPWMAKPSRQMAGVDNDASEYSRPMEIKNDDIVDNSDNKDQASTKDDVEKMVVENVNDVEATDLGESIYNKSKGLIVHDLSSALEGLDDASRKAMINYTNKSDAIDDIFHDVKLKMKNKLKEEKKPKKKMRHRKIKRLMKEEFEKLKEKVKKQKEDAQQESNNGDSDVTDDDNDDDDENMSDAEKKTVKRNVVAANNHDDDDLANFESTKRKQTLEEIENTSDNEFIGFAPSKKQKLVETKERNKKTGENVPTEPKEDFVDPKKLFTLETKLKSVGAGPTIIDNDDDDNDVDVDDEQRMTIAQAFASDDVIEEFTKEKNEIINKATPKDIDMTIPGWGRWGGKGVKVNKKQRKRFIKKAPAASRRKDQHLGHVIINEAKVNAVKQHQVAAVPYPFNNAQQFEASLKTPLGKDWNPETVRKDLTKPKILTKLGKIIAPIDKSVAFEDYKKEREKMKAENSEQKNDGKMMGRKKPSDKNKMGKDRHRNKSNGKKMTNKKKPSDKNKMGKNKSKKRNVSKKVGKKFDKSKSKTSGNVKKRK